MQLREIRFTGIGALNLATTLLQRARLTNPNQGVFEAADVQWSWRTSRKSDSVEKVFWCDDDDPVAGLWLTSSANNEWQADPIIVPHVADSALEIVWDRLLETRRIRPESTLIVPIAEDDTDFQGLAREAGMVAAAKDFTGWMHAKDRPTLVEPVDGFTLVDRTIRAGTPHPMQHLNGPHVETRLGETSLYDPSLDLSIEGPNGEITGYSLYWFDPVTKVGLVEPVRIQEEFQRRGLAKAIVANGINRLVSMGAERIKVSWESAAAGALYQGVGFTNQSTTTWYTSTAR